MKADLKLNISMPKTPESRPLQTDQVSLRLSISLAVIRHWLKTAFSYSLGRGLGLGTTLDTPEGRDGASELRGADRSNDRSGSDSSLGVP